MVGIHGLYAIGGGTLQLYLVNVAVGPVDGEAQNLLTSFQLRTDITLHDAIGIPAVAARLGHTDVEEGLGDLTVLNQAHGETRTRSA